MLSENRIHIKEIKRRMIGFYPYSICNRKELEENPLIQPEDVIQVDLPIGLPPKHYAELCERYESYFKKARENP